MKFTSRTIFPDTLWTFELLIQIKRSKLGNFAQTEGVLAYSQWAGHCCCNRSGATKLKKKLLKIPIFTLFCSENSQDFSNKQRLIFRISPVATRRQVHGSMYHASKLRSEKVIVFFFCMVCSYLHTINVTSTYYRLPF